MGREPADHAERLYRAYGSVCLGYARTLCGRRGPVEEDIVHDVFVRFLRQADVPPDERCRGYLLAAVRNTAANYLRDEARRQAHLQRYARQAPMFTAPPDDHSGLDLGELLLRLPRDQREVVYLKIWGGRTFAQIGVLTGAPLQTVASRFRYGLAKLREMMEPPSDGRSGPDIAGRR